jgi:hypothetical protein
LVSDGFESFCRSQLFPHAIHLLCGARSQYLFVADYATLRRKGRMTEEQKRMREALEKLCRINDPVALERTHADEAGISGEAQKRALKRITTVRRFLSFQSLPEPMERVWRRSYETPLRTVEPTLLRPLKRAVRKGVKDIEVAELVKTLDLDSVTTDKKQYLPAHALG